MGMGGCMAGGTKGEWADTDTGPAKYVGGVVTNEVGVVVTER